MRVLSGGIFAIGLLVTVTVSAAESLQVRDAWIREAPPNATALAAFATLQNPSAMPRTLVGARSTAAAKLELHKTVMEGEVAKMVPQESIEVAAGGEVKLQPGGLHIMLISPKHPLKAGDKLEIVLEFKDGVNLPVTFQVRGGGMPTGHGVEHNHMGHSH